MADDLRQILAAKVTESGGRLAVKSALNPALWLCAIISAPAILAAAITSNVSIVLGFLAVAPVILAMGGFVFLLLFDRDKLQSEDYQIKKQSLELFQQKGMGMALPIAEILGSVTPDQIAKTSRDGGEE